MSVVAIKCEACLGFGTLITVYGPMLFRERKCPVCDGEGIERPPTQDKPRKGEERTDE